ncbi:hypothetical protein ACFQ0B_28880 [Nonomuraea thailandensis]
MGEAGASALPYGLLALFAWLNRRWAAVACAAGYSLLTGWSISRRDYEFAAGNADGVLVQANPVEVSDIAMGLVPSGLCAVMLAVAPSPGPGSAGTPRLLKWTVAVAGSSVLAAMIARWAGLPVAAVLVLVAGALALRSPVGRRVAVVLVPVIAVMAVHGINPLHEVLTVTLSVAVLGVAGVLARAGSAPSSAAGAGSRAGRPRV